MENRFIKKCIGKLILTCVAVAGLILIVGQASANPVNVQIETFDVGMPIITVTGAPNGYSVDTGPYVVKPGLEYGAYITLAGVDTNGLINEPGEQGWRFIEPSLPVDTLHNALEIVWILHDSYGEPGQTGDLQIGFDSLIVHAAPNGLLYFNPSHVGSQSAGPVGQGWVTLYSDSTLTLEYNARGVRPVPEPSSLALMVFGGVGFAMTAYRRRRTAN